MPVPDIAWPCRGYPDPTPAPTPRPAPTQPGERTPPVQDDVRTPPEGWDLVVVGAGPAGSSAALGALTADPTLRVLLLDRSDFPRDKSCGDGIAPHVVDALASVGAPTSSRLGAADPAGSPGRRPR